MSSKSRLKIASRLSVQPSPQGSTPSNLSPATHKKNVEIFANSPLNSPMLSHLVNDDYSEKKRRLKARLSDAAQNHLNSPASEKYVYLSCITELFSHNLIVSWLIFLELFSFWCHCDFLNMFCCNCVDLYYNIVTVANYLCVFQTKCFQSSWMERFADNRASLQLYTAF